METDPVVEIDPESWLPSRFSAGTKDGSLFSPAGTNVYLSKDSPFSMIPQSNGTYALHSNDGSLFTSSFVKGTGRPIGKVSWKSGAHGPEGEGLVYREEFDTLGMVSGKNCQVFLKLNRDVTFVGADAEELVFDEDIELLFGVGAMTTSGEGEESLLGSVSNIMMDLYHSSPLTGSLN